MFHSLDFGLTKLNIFSSMVLTYLPRVAYSIIIRIMQGLSKDVRALCLLGWPESTVSEDGLEALAVERMLKNDEEYKEYLEDIEPYHGGPCRIFEIF
ncbi:AIE_G0016610.mRNA.1.CDS.1 [Saccharomyces cerevisiae]|nr:AIE_G0016610.mRNA.1.CDS.1 [Saccharomyces cerevisiae]CAI6638821.1 AIE_G0016610.mRNA.1.CDS.1 [Saccharomyces cerevisiae]